MYETITGLKEKIAAVMPLLDANLTAAYNEWMSGSLAKSAFEYCSTRHLAAGHIMEANPEELVEEAALAASARLFLDLRSALKDVPTERKASAEAMVQGLRDFLITQGFTETNVFFDIPMRPVSAVSASSFMTA